MAGSTKLRLLESAITFLRRVLKPKSGVRACLDFGFLEEWILFGF